VSSSAIICCLAGFWMVGDEPLDHSTFSANRARLLEHAGAKELFRGVVKQAYALKLPFD
jgi:transposase